MLGQRVVDPVLGTGNGGSLGRTHAAAMDEAGTEGPALLALDAGEAGDAVVFLDDDDR